MLDVLGALCLGTVFAVDAVVLIGLAAIQRRAKILAFAIATAWIVLIVSLAAAGGFAANVTGPFPAPVIPFLILMVGGLSAFFASRVFRSAFLSVPLAALVGINVFRTVGGFFLLLHAQGRLGAPFSTSAGWGDVITGVVAVPLALLAWKGTAPRWLLAFWNAFGALDLITAITLGALSAPGTPFNVFREAPGTVAMATLPWVAIPTSLVPLYLMTHLVIAVQLRGRSSEGSGTWERSKRLSAGATVGTVA